MKSSTTQLRPPGNARWRLRCTALATAAALAGAGLLAGADPALADAPLGIVATVPVGANPYAVALSPDGARAYVVNEGSNSVSVVATATDTVTATVAVGASPVDVAVSPDGSRAYVTNAGSDSVSVLDTATETVTSTISTSGWGQFLYGVAVSPDGRTLYATLAHSGSVVVIDAATGTVTGAVTVGGEPLSVAFSPDGGTVYISDYEGGSVSVIDTATKSVTTTIGGLAAPQGVAVSPDGSTVYTADTGDRTVGVIDTATDRLTTTIGGVGAQPADVEVSPDGSHVYVADISGSVSEIDTATGTVGSALNLSSNPISLAVSPEGDLVYVALNGSNTLDVLSAAPAPTVTAVSPGSGPASGGTMVTITGTDLAGVTGVAFGPGNPATAVSCTATTCTATAPADAAGTVDVRVTTPSGTSATGTGDQYTYIAAPVITAVTPTSGPPGGGTVVTITGTHLSGASIAFGAGNPATDVNCTATSCTATAPAEHVGTVDVLATTTGGTSAAGAADHYTYAASDLAVALTASGVPGLLSGHITYTVTITDKGPSALTSATVTATLPAPMTATGSACTASGEHVTCALGTLASGTSTTRTFTVSVGLLTLGLPYTVRVARTAGTPVDTNPANDSATRTCTVVTSLIINCG